MNGNFEIELGTTLLYGFCHFRCGIRPISRLVVKSRSKDALIGAELEVSSEGFLLPFKKQVDAIPYESAVEVDLDGLQVLQAKLLEIEERGEARIDALLKKDGQTLAQASRGVALLPYETYPGTGAYPELFSCFVRPAAKGVDKILKDAHGVLREWKAQGRQWGYDEAGKAKVKLQAAAIFKAVQSAGISWRSDHAAVDLPFHVQYAEETLSKRQAALFDMAALYLSCLEAAGLNGIAALGENGCVAGAWLRDNCFLSSSFDDVTEIKKRCDESIDDIAVFDVKALFSELRQSPAFAEKSALSEIQGGKYFTIIDVKRCRIGGFRPLSPRVRDNGGFRIEEDPELKPDDMPRLNKKNLRPLRIKPLPAKESQWERRLLDLSLRNSLLNFSPKRNVIPIMSYSLERTLSHLLSGEEFSLLEIPPEILPGMAGIGGFDAPPKVRPLRELVELEMKNRRLRSFLLQKDLAYAASALYRKEKVSMEETGTSALYAACGFLKWSAVGEKNGYRYAPLILLPVSLIKRTGGRGFSVKIREDEYQVNTTLLEFLKQEFGIEMRGLESAPADLDSLLGMVKKQILGYPGWEVVEDVYIASLSFSRFLMWNDLRCHIDAFRQNRFIRSMIEGRPDPSLARAKEAEVVENIGEKDAMGLFLPLSCDSAQLKAVLLSDRGVSFVLHGPPGTGKSQTITNIIANAIAKGKSVLFVAEKLAALSVVKKRLDDIGIGDFCLELHSVKTAKTEVCRKLVETAALREEKESPYQGKLEQLVRLKEQVAQPFCALHRKRGLGFSIYQAILKVMEYQDTPDVFEIDALFFEKLTREKFEKCQALLSELVAVCRECGRIYRSPFENVGILDFDERVRYGILTSVKVIQEEARHLKAYNKYCLEMLGGRVRVVTKARLELLKEICLMLTRPENPYMRFSRYGGGSEAVRALNEFMSVYKEYERQESRYGELFRARVDLPESLDLLKEELEKFPVLFHKSKPLKVLIKRIGRASRHKLRPENTGELIEAAISYHEAKQNTAQAGQKLWELLTGGKERINYDMLADFIMQLESLYTLVTKLFPSYDYSSFNALLKNLFTRYPMEIFAGFLRAYDSFEQARKSFFKVLEIEKDFEVEGEDYTDFLYLKAAAIFDNIDMLSSWCRFNRLSRTLRAEGLQFALSAILAGRITADQILACFNKKVYSDFVEKEVAEDPVLSKFSSSSTENKIERLKELIRQFEGVTRQEIRLRLISRLPSLSSEGGLSLELMQLQRAHKSNMRGYTVRGLFSGQKNLLSMLAPCLLMSPTAVSQYLGAQPDMFDLVIFDEASQIPTAEAIGALARSKCAIVVGDPRQLPPTTFFMSDYIDEENLEYEDLESVLEDCLALNLPERHLKWHYRSRHESLIAFSNAMYYGNKLCTFPSTNALQSKVQFRYVENGVYQRGSTKQNPIEADALVEEVVSRLKDPEERGKSIGIITFSVAQQVLIEHKLSEALVRHKLEAYAYDREEPLFVKNLENVQGDEREVILFSICYGPDKYGRLSLNFGPVNHQNGWRRLNVAVSRAREEMIVFSSMTSAMIDLGRTNSKGVADVKAFLEFAQNGRTTLAVRPPRPSELDGGIGKYIAKELSDAGYECRPNLGVSDFKIDVAVMAPGGDEFILAIMCDSSPSGAGEVSDSLVLQVNMLKRLGWNVLRIWTLNFLGNPKREVRRIKQYIDRLCNKGEGPMRENKFLRPYTEAVVKRESVLSGFLLNPKNEEEVKDKLKKIVAAEQPIAKELLIKKCLLSYGVIRSGSRLNSRMKEILASMGFKAEEHNGVTFLRDNDDVLSCDFFRVDGECRIRRSPTEISPYEIVAAAKSVLTDKISLYLSDLVKEAARELRLPKVTEEAENAIRYAVKYGSKRGIFTISASDMVSL